ncbi:GNAT family N-acetyltransferase [Vagococcus fluvialis]|jgi:ElaA protein|uniref:GNAT family N-acetyltransferase n=1 Tax=Vagococcus fluvialis TaxID=2738 RepID=UPI001432FCC0|nr:GNAT family N-acetyltransferase [Vagococcus fluvialis]MDR2278028.1 GNAT family N-acetyltransferase [Vagococcus sp.]MBO0444578.1 GNAT family N-acetyltransferase [Vagococcus fluvialis]MBO0488323.1 GNAT family N-acetyltransferase [Vagococcus fluvialis]MCM2140133.1 GNAT family N-acetyltransferase [Vagococcus fluvialis]MDT2746989.1 GNAT family N-acetyltransferase [Vagococcus fluvialis]
MKLIVKELNEMTAEEFFEVAKERVKVFVVEQTCPYQEIDEDDKVAKHIILKNDDNQIMAYTRIMNRVDYVTFGRVLVVEEFRGQELGKKIVELTLAEINQLNLKKDIKISAQNYLTDFYGNFGFEVISDVYLEDDIPHIDMLLKVN